VQVVVQAKSRREVEAAEEVMESNEDGTPKVKLLTDDYVQRQLRLQSGYTGVDLAQPRLLYLHCSGLQLPSGNYTWQIREFLPKESLWAESPNGGFMTMFSAKTSRWASSPPSPRPR